MYCGKNENQQLLHRWKDRKQISRHQHVCHRAASGTVRRERQKIKSRAVTCKTCCCVAETEKKRHKGASCKAQSATWKLASRVGTGWGWGLTTDGIGWSGSWVREAIGRAGWRSTWYRQGYASPLVVTCNLDDWAHHLNSVQSKTRTVCTQSTGTQNNHAPRHICTSTQHFRSFSE